ncbi:MAG: aspartyl protease family protein [Steroidobacteraceae bacterium]
MKRGIALFLLALLPQIAAAGPTSDSQVLPRQHRADYSFPSNARSVTIPFRFIGKHIYFPAEIDGHEYQFGLDTGGMNIIAASVARAIGLRSEGSAQATGAGEKRVAVSFAKIPAVSLDSKLTIRNQMFVIVPLSGISAVEGTTLDGVVGYELLKRFVVRIDYANRRLQILRPTDFDTRSAGTAVPFTYDGRMPQVAGSLDGLPGRFDIDTGSRDVLSINSPFVKAHHLLHIYHQTARMVTGWGAGGAAYGRLARAREFLLDDVPVGCPVVELSTQAEGTDAERSVAGVIGNGILSRFTVTFDYPKQLVYLRRNSSYGSPFSYDRAGMWVNRLNRSFLVQFVMAEGPAQRTGLRKGDVIVSVDHKQAGSVELAEFRRMLADSPVGTRVDLRVVRAGRTLPMTVILRDLIPRCTEMEK